jgi:hypothetical protein
MMKTSEKLLALQGHFAEMNLVMAGARGPLTTPRAQGLMLLQSAAEAYIAKNFPAKSTEMPHEKIPEYLNTLESLLMQQKIIGEDRAFIWAAAADELLANKDFFEVAGLFLNAALTAAWKIEGAEKSAEEALAQQAPVGAEGAQGAQGAQAGVEQAGVPGQPGTPSNGLRPPVFPINMPPHSLVNGPEFEQAAENVLRGLPAGQIAGRATGKHPFAPADGLFVSKYDDNSIELVDGQLRPKKAVKLEPHELKRSHEDTLLKLVSKARGDLKDPMVKEWKGWTGFVSDVSDPRHGYDFQDVHDFVRQAEHERTTGFIDTLSVPEQACKFQHLIMSKLSKRLRDSHKERYTGDSTPSGTCHFYNSQAGCDRTACKFAHRCAKKGCSEKHPAHEHK